MSRRFMVDLADARRRAGCCRSRASDIYAEIQPRRPKERLNAA
jgi:hypothetical protein